MSQQTSRGGAAAPPRFNSALGSEWPGRQGTPAALSYFIERAAEIGAVEALQAARAQGRKVVGVFCSFIPEELILGLNAAPVRLCGGIPAAGAGDLPRDACPVVRGALERLASGPLTELIDGLVLPTTCDWKVQSVRRLAGRFRLWQVEVPRSPEPEALAAEFRRLADELSELTGFSLSRRALAEATEIVNRARAAHRRLEALRRRPLPPISGCEAMLVADAYGYGDIEGWTEACERLAEAGNGTEAFSPSSSEGPGRKCPRPIIRPRILLAGSPMIWPNFKAPELVENTGGVVVGDDFCSRSSRLRAEDIRPGPLRDMLQALARRAIEPCTCGVLGQRAERERVVAQARELTADGVVCHYLRGCAPVAAHQAAVLRALRDGGLPALTLETDASEEDVENLRTRIEAFMELLTARG